MHYSDDETLLFAVPKDGRLYEHVMRLLDGAGLDHRRAKGVDVAVCTGLPVTLLFLPPADIAKYVGRGNVDMGITGRDIIAESKTDIDELLPLGFGCCRLALQAPTRDGVTSATQLAGKRIATTFPTVANEFFTALERDGAPPTTILSVSGSVQVACALGLADGVVDLVQTGATMRTVGLEPVATLLESEAVLIKNPRTTKHKLVHTLHQRVLGYVTTTQFKMVTYNIEASKLEQAKQVTPGRRAPTVTTLNGGHLVSVAVMVARSEVAHIMDLLQDVGATDIMMLSFDNCRVNSSNSYSNTNADPTPW